MSTPTATKRWPTLFIAHGGGPWPFMPASPDPAASWDGLGRYLTGLDASLGERPKAVLVISGHWEESRPTVNTGAHPGMLYDYYGFPADTYKLSYPAPGSPELAARVRSLLEAAGIASGEDPARGYDHGVFIPFMLIYPHADVPLLQLSLQRELDPKAHLALGRALAPLRDEGVLIVGSGMSFHNLRALFSPDPGVGVAAEAFDAWLTEAVEQHDPQARDAKLAAWASAPAALASHPRSEHLVPLFVAAGAAGADIGRRTFHDHIFGKAYSGFQFG
ncbi:class III extradiol ring-cleavage dioxygenase [Xanthobacter sp. V4C-4]|uniref:DODA-type extradiol aromatic ring-opening family dioxygenase n=1 Tax=Xanthobacter cornucopiae TaxID=3119924 RepID=UPI0037296322